MKQRFATLAIISLFGVLGTASASVLGQLNVTNCASGGVTVSGTSIDWLLPAGGGNGCIQADTLTNVTFGVGGTIVSGEQGLIKDLVFNVTPGTGFMTFSGPNPAGFGSGSVSFDLVTLGPGSTTDCTATMLIGTTCSVQGMGPILLLRTGANSTSISLSAAGTVFDPTDGKTSDWSGLYTTQFSNLAPFDIEEFIEGIHPADTSANGVCNNGTGQGGSCTSTYSGSFDVTITATPEPGSLMLIGGGLLGLAVSLRKRKK